MITMDITSNPYYDECSNELKALLKEYEYGKIKKDKHDGQEYSVSFDRRIFCFGCDEGRNGKFIKKKEKLKSDEKIFEFDVPICEGCFKVYTIIKQVSPPLVWNLSHEGIIEFRIPYSLFRRYSSYLNEFFRNFDKDTNTVVLSCTDGGIEDCDNLILKLMIIKKTEQVTSLFWIDNKECDKGITKIDWSRLSPTVFEEFCAYILTNDGFTNIEWQGKGGGDKGRDLLAKKLAEPAYGIQDLKKWLVSCKRYIVKAPSITVLNDVLVKADQHDIDFLLFIITNTITSNTRDWLNDVKKQHKYEIYLWEEIHLKPLIFSYKNYLLTYFPELYNPPTSKPRYGIFMDHFLKKFEYVHKEIKNDVIKDVVTYLKKNKPSFSEKDIIEDKLPSVQYDISSSWFNYNGHELMNDFSDFKNKIKFILELFYEQTIESVPQCQDIGAMLEKQFKEKYTLKLTFYPMFNLISATKFILRIFNTIDPPYYNFDFEIDKKKVVI